MCTTHEGDDEDEWWRQQGWLWWWWFADHHGDVGEDGEGQDDKVVENDYKDDDVGDSHHSDMRNR